MINTATYLSTFNSSHHGSTHIPLEVHCKWLYLAALYKFYWSYKLLELRYIILLSTYTLSINYLQVVAKNWNFYPVGNSAISKLSPEYTEKSK